MGNCINVYVNLIISIIIKPSDAYLPGWWTEYWHFD